MEAGRINHLNEGAGNLLQIYMYNVCTFYMHVWIDVVAPALIWEDNNFMDYRYWPISALKWLILQIHDNKINGFILKPERSANITYVPFVFRKIKTYAIQTTNK